eukprot:gi/632991448/ref/XP_007884631.1/ PREDICTED: metastasis-associated protein MTA2-like [Callorhinchus milii]
MFLSPVSPIPIHIRQMTASPHPADGRPLPGGAKVERGCSEPPFKRQKVNSGDTPDPIVFVATDHTRTIRKALTQSEMRRAARRPCLQVNVKPIALNRPSSLTEPIVLGD